MLIVPEREIADLLTRDASFDAVEKVFAAMAAGDAYNFPVIREAIGHEDALYGFKGGFDGKGLTLGLKAMSAEPKRSYRQRKPESRCPLHQLQDHQARL